MNYNKVILFITLVFICLVIIHYNSKIQLDKTIIIHQIEQIILENINSLKKSNMPIVIKFKCILYHINLTRLKQMDNTDLTFSDKIEKIPLSQEILPSVNIINRFKNTLNVQSNFFLYVLPKDTKSSYLKSNVSENFFILHQGKVIFRLFHPDNLRYFNFSKKNDSNYHYKLDKSKSKNIPTYIDIILHKEQGLLVPYNWIFQIITINQGLLINYQYTDLFSKIAFLCLT